ncbi:MAG: NifU family protein [Tenericutes bacterium]|nr:NifU family protein [Mycoplasmatota bacterium]
MEQTVIKIKEVLDRVRPQLQEDGGDVEFVKFEDGLVFVKVHGACVGCSYINVTLYDGIESILLAEVPGVIGVELVE